MEIKRKNHTLLSFVSFFVAFNLIACAKKNVTDEVVKPTQPPAENPENTKVTEPVLIKVGAFVVNGKSCVGSGSFNVTSSEILFETETRTEFDMAITRKACTMVLPVEIPVDKILVVDHFEVRSSLDLGSKMKAQTQVESFFAGQIGEVLIHAEENLSEVLVSKEKLLISSAVLKTGCGQAVNLRTNISSIVQGGREPALATTGSVKFTYHLEACPN